MSIPSPTEPPASTGFDTARIAAQLRRWQERLLDLTKRNPLLGLNHSRVSKLSVTDPDGPALFDRFVVSEEELRMPLVRRKSSAPPREDGEESVEDRYLVEPGDVSFDANSPDVLMKRLRRIYDNARTTVEERGVTTLHLAFGVLRWEDPSLGESFCPLWLVPCQFEYKGPATALRLQHADEEMQLNPALELYLRERHHISLPPIPEEPVQGGLVGYLEAIRTAVREQGWTVTEEAWLSTFSFESLVIYQDLKVMTETATKNGIVAAFARARSTTEGSEALAEELDTLPTPDRVPVPILPTDASQLRALTLAAAKQNLVIHGPPGTGKSQTISNLIADALARRQSVLFVSAKMAALDVVHDRLAERGLARFCLEAHSTKAGKAKIIEELKRTLDSSGDGDGLSLGEQLQDLQKIRKDLNDYVLQLHERREPLSLSVYQGIGRVAKLHEIPDVTSGSLPWGDILRASRADLRAAVDLLDELGGQAGVFDLRGTHPWRGLIVDPTAGVDADVLKASLLTTAVFARKLSEAFEALVDIFGTSGRVLSIDQIHALAPALALLAKCDRLPSGWHSLAVERLQASTDLLTNAEAKAKHLAERRAEYEACVCVPVLECLAMLGPLRREFRGWARVLKPRFWAWQAAVRKILRPGASSKMAALRSYLNLANQLAKLDAWFEVQSATLRQLIGSNEIRDPNALGQSALEYRTATQLRIVLDGEGIIPTATTTVSPGMKTAAKFAAEHVDDPAASEAIGRISQAWPGGFVDGVPGTSATLPSLQARCEEALHALSRLHEWIVLSDTLCRCREVGLTGFIEALGSTSARMASKAFEKRVYTLWTNRVMERTPALQLFTPERRTERTERFRQLDQRIRETALAHVKAIAAEPARNITRAQTNLSTSSEVGVLRRELQKRKRIKPLRKLFAEIPRVLQALKPCMLMSPLSVSTFLKPGGISFDLVVFDEASQLPTAEAIPAILRAEQVVVAGDEKQLPPTSFFDATVIFDEDGPEETDEELEPLESLLDDCVAVNPVFLPTYLRWHYRSRDERLINFSNHYFYNNALVTFPSATTSNDGKGVHHVYVPDGVWDRGRSRTNRREAQRVAELVVEQFERFPDRSIGVVAMNSTQREAIEIALNEMIEQRPELTPLLGQGRAEPFFIKALENVQGDERDTMLISMGYAKTASGALSLNFGPLNREGGWRRLNVLVTRAKWQTFLVTSVHSQELAGVNPNNRGAFMLRKFIEYAEGEGKLPPDPATPSREETNDFEEAVAEALRQSDLLVDEQVGVGGYRIDLAIRDPRDATRYLLGVECDGATYHSAKTARDRDLLRQQVLRDQGWRLHRVWSTHWFRDRNGALRSILRSVELAMGAGADAAVRPPGGPTPAKPGQAEAAKGGRGHSKSEEPSRTYTAGVPYRKYHPSLTRDSDGIMNGDRVAELAAQVRSVAHIEAPIHQEVLLDRLKEIYGVSRAGSNIQENTRRAITLAVRQHGIRHETQGGFLYFGAGTLEAFRVNGDGVERSITQIAPEEIALAVLFAVEDQFGFPRDHLPKAVAELFGLGKATVGVSEVVGNVVDTLVEDQRLRLSGPIVYLP